MSASSAPVIVLAHGSRHPLADQAVHQVAEAVGAEAAFLDFSPRTLENQARLLAAQGHKDISVLPLLFTDAFHARHDVPETVAETERALGVNITVTDSLGTGEDIAELLVIRVQQALAYQRFTNIVIYAVVMAVFPQPVNWTVLLIIPALFLFALNAIWVTIVFGILSTRFRDIGQLLATVVQLVFFMTPIIWTTDNLGQNAQNSSRLKLVELNPMFHYLEIARGPLLGEPVEFYHWAVVLGCTAVGWVLAMMVMRNYRARVAYWV